MSKSKGTTKAEAVKTVTQEEAKEYLSKMKQPSFIDADDSDECVPVDGEFDFTSGVPHFGCDSDNECTTVRGDADTDSSHIFGDINDSPDFYDSEGETDRVNAMKTKYRTQRQTHA